MPNSFHFMQGGENYALYRPTYPASLASALAQQCVETKHALDVGCGTGQFSLLLAEHFERITATDPSQSQLDSAQAHPKIDYRAETAEVISLPNQSVDLIVAAQAAHWFDLPKFYIEAKRIAKSGCRLAFVSYGVPTMQGDVGKRLSQFYWKEIHPFWPDGRKHVETGYKTLDFPYEETSLPGLSIERDWSRAELLGYISTWSAVRRAEEAGAEKHLKRFAADVMAIWPEDEKRRIVWPITARIGAVS